MKLDGFLDAAERIVERHRLGPGQYARWLWHRDGREMGVNPYGCADAANILYTLGRFPADEGERRAFVETMRGMQDEKTGLFTEATHHPIHTTAHVTAALELFEARPAHRLASYDPYRSREGLYALLDGLDWQKNPWNMSHRGAGLYAAMKLAGESTEEWESAYFDWLWSEADPVTGLWRRGFADVAPVSPVPIDGIAPQSWHLAGTFHYLFNCEYAKMPLRYPDRLMDTCLNLYRHGAVLPTFGRMVGFMEIDWVFCLSRALRQSGRRFAEAKEALDEFARSYTGYLLSLDPETDEGLNDLHMLFGALCALAELQAALPGRLTARTPLKLVLDRRPFI